MGIGSTIKNMMQPDSNTANTDPNAISSDVHVLNRGNGSFNGSSPAPARRSTASHKLPPGRGPGTSGKPASEVAMEHDRARTLGGDIAGHGTDSAAAHGGSLAGTHLDRGGRPGVTSQNAAESRDRTLGVPSVDRGLNSGLDTSPGADGRLLDPAHEATHQRGVGGQRLRDIMPPDNANEETNQLNPVTRERVRHLETEEVQREIEREHHVHHIQYHTQPIHTSETLPEQVREQIHPISHVREVHPNQTEDKRRFEGQVKQHRDSLTHHEKERTVIDKGIKVKTVTHHHVHHLIQPVIEKETIDRSRIRTTIPIREVIHEAPIIHQSLSHSAVPIEQFLQGGGILSGAIPQDDIGSRVLHTDQYTREVDGLADTLSRELQLGESPPAFPREDPYTHQDGVNTGLLDTRGGQELHQPVTTDSDPPVPLA